MAEWIDAVAVAALADGEKVVVDTDAGKIVVCCIGRDYFAVEDRCSHDGGELASGACDGDELICPRHGARFCVRSGKALTPPAYEDIETFPVRVAAGMVQVDID